MFVLPNSVFSQIELKIKELKVSNINIKPNLQVINEDLENGPFINFICSFKNCSKEKIILHPSKSKFYVLFNFKGTQHEQKVFPLAFLDYDTISIEEKQCEEVFFGTYLLLGTPYLKKNGGDYTSEMLQILPTLKILYKENDGNLKVRSDEIINVILN